MKSKLGRIIKEISSSEESVGIPGEEEEYPLTPEKVAVAFSKWKKKRLGETVSYFRNGKRINSKAWDYFEKLAQRLNHWTKVCGGEFGLWEYFDAHLKRVGKGVNLYPSQLFLDYSYEIILGKDSMDPSIVEMVESVMDYDYCLRVLKSWMRDLNKSAREVFELCKEDDFYDSLTRFPKWFIKEYVRRNPDK